MAGRPAKAPPHALVPGLRTLGRKHCATVAEAIGADASSPEALAASLLDERALEAIVASLDAAERRLVTRTAYGPLYAWTNAREPLDEAAAQTLERHGLLFVLENHWSTTVAVPHELEGPLQRLQARAVTAPADEYRPGPEERTVWVPDQVLHDAAALAALIGSGGIQVKADGGLFARAVTRLGDGLAPLPELDEATAGARLNLALAVLEENGALRVRVTDAGSGANRKRELALARDVAAMLDVDAAGRKALMDALRHVPGPGTAIVDIMLDTCAGRTIAVGAVGGALKRLFGEAGKQLPFPDPSIDDALIGTAAVTERWLRGDVAFVLDRGGVPTAVVFRAAESHEETSPPCVAQGDFELVTMRPTTPGERAALLSVAEPVPGREHVARVTKARVLQTLGADPALDVIARLERVAGTLPQNVQESVRGWAAQLPARARLRTAMMLAVDDEAVADRLAFALGALMVERLGPTLLAVDAAAQPAVGDAVRQAGVELAEGLDRVSGVWRERPDEGEHAWWRPTPQEQRPVAGPPNGKLVSRVGQVLVPAPASPTPSTERDDGLREVARRLAAAGLVGDLDLEEVEALLREEDDDEEEAAVGDVILDAFHAEAVVRLEYAAAAGVRRQWVTVQDLDGARVQVRDHATGERSWLWLRAISEAQIMA